MLNNKNIFSFKGKKPILGKEIYVAPNAYIIGDVIIDDFCAVMFGAIIRGDVNYIRIGKYTNIQDNSILHVTRKKFPLNIGSYVSIGHSAIVHGCNIGNYVLIGIGAKILDGAKVGDNTIIAAGSVVKEGDVIPSNTLVAGIPAKVKREITEKDFERIKFSAESYNETRKDYLELMGGIK